jgi:hypothetical protein
MPVTLIKSSWVNGDLVFQKVVATGNPQYEFGIDGTGLDVIFYGDTASANMLWDESANSLVFSGDATIGPASGFWAGAPSAAITDPSNAYKWHEDFIDGLRLPAASGSTAGWKSSGDATYDLAAAAGSIGGHIQTAPETGSNNEVYFQLGERGTETYIEYVKDSGLKSWVEFRMTLDSITNAANTFVGVASEGAAAANFIADAGDDFADVDLLGFVVWEADPDAIDCTHQLTGGAFADPGLAGVPVAGTAFTLGLYFDGAETLTYYYNGSAVQTADLDTATFPTDEEMSPMIALKNGAADAGIDIDWITMVVER